MVLRPTLEAGDLRETLRGNHDFRLNWRLT